MLLSCEEWRKEFGVDDIVKYVAILLHASSMWSTYFLRRNFDFTEMAEVDKYYPAFYHKTDKVCLDRPIGDSGLIEFS